MKDEANNNTERSYFSRYPTLLQESALLLELVEHTRRTNLLLHRIALAIEGNHKPNRAMRIIARLANQDGSGLQTGITMAAFTLPDSLTTKKYLTLTPVDAQNDPAKVVNVTFTSSDQTKLTVQGPLDNNPLTAEVTFLLTAPGTVGGVNYSMQPTLDDGVTPDPAAAPIAGTATFNFTAGEATSATVSLADAPPNVVAPPAPPNPAA